MTYDILIRWDSQFQKKSMSLKLAVTRDATSTLRSEGLFQFREDYK